MLNAAEKPICFVECQHFIAWKKIQLTKCSQGFEHTRFLQERMMRSVDELQRLHNNSPCFRASAPAAQPSLPDEGADRHETLSLPDEVLRMFRGLFSRAG